ncbi:MAG: DNA pilot protein [Microvirus sp.]|nr:MAG: DNA pilot protein [Microvirus sp.]
MGILSSIGHGLSSAASALVKSPLTGAIGGPIVGALSTAYGAYSANKQNKQNQKKQFAQETDLANTAVQRRKADLEAAGFNPLLAVGSSAETPSAAPAHSENVAREAGGQLGGAFGSAMQAINMQASALQASAHADMTRSLIPGAADLQSAQTSQANTASDVNRSVRDKVNAEISNVKADTDLKGVQKSLVRVNTYLEGQHLQQLSDLLPGLIRLQQQAIDVGAPAAAVARGPYGQLLEYIRAIAGTANPALGSAAILRGIFK